MTDSAMEESTFFRDMGLFAVVIVSGMLGMYTQSITVLCSVLFGAIAAYIAYQFPTWYKQTQARLQQESRTNGVSAHDNPPSIDLPSSEAVKHLIVKRRTIYPKDFNGGEVSRGEIEALLEAANWAPTHNLTEPWRFVVLQKDAKKQFEDLTVSLVKERTAPEKREAAVQKVTAKQEKHWPLVSAYIAICMKRVPNKGGKLNPEWEELCTIGAAVQNMHLLASSMGVAAMWSSWQEGARDADEMKQFLGLSLEDRCLGMLVLGRSDRAASYRGSRKPWAEKVTWKS